MNKELIGIIAGGISLVAYAPYIYSIFQRRTKPSRSSWWIWSLVGLIILVSYYGVGARNTIWIPLGLFICPLLIALLSIKYGSGKGFNTLDKACFSLAVIGVALWFILDSPAIALGINVFIDFIGFLPTFQKTYAHPRKENRFAWTLFFMGSILNLVALEGYHLQLLLYPAYMFAMDIIMMWIFFLKSFNGKKNYAR